MESSEAAAAAAAAAAPPPPPQYWGLHNQGATCYLNSVLQVLFMSPEFREAVQRFSRENPDSDFIDHQLNDLFEDLQKSQGYTFKITTKLSINNVYEQRDAAEYYERILQLTSRPASQIFHGLLRESIACFQCSTTMDTDGAFWLLPLALVDYQPKSVEAGIEVYFSKEYLTGANQMYCDGCGSKSDSTISSVLLRPPEVLTLLLKRFALNYMMYVKNNCRVDVPYTLQIPQTLTSYELYAFVDHVGDLRSGHYTATIRSPDDGRWYKFNDATVTTLDEQPFEGSNSERSNTVYLLFYRKTKDTGTSSSGTTSSDLSPEEKDIPEKNGDQQKTEGVEDSGPNEDTVVMDDVSPSSGDHLPSIEHRQKNMLEDHEKVGERQAEDPSEQVRCFSGEEPPEEQLKEQDLEDQDVDDTRDADDRFGNHDVKPEPIVKEDKKVEQTDKDHLVEQKDLLSRQDLSQEREDDQVQDGEDVDDTRKDDVIQSDWGENNDVKPEISDTASKHEGLSTKDKKMRDEPTEFTLHKECASSQEKVTDDDDEELKNMKNISMEDQEGRPEGNTSSGACSSLGNGSEECETQPEKAEESSGPKLLVEIIEEESIGGQTTTTIVAKTLIKSKKMLNKEQLDKQ